MVQNKKRFIFGRRKAAPKPKPNYAFIDSQNLNLGTQRVGWKMDWKKFRQFLRDNYNVEKAFMFIGYVQDNEDLYKQMQEAGYLVVLKPTVEIYMTKEEVDSDKHVTKGNVDAELVLYAMKELPNYSKAVVVSGDGDFVGLVEYLDHIGKLSHLLAPNDNFSSLYKPFESKISVLDRSKRQLAYGFIKKKSHSNGSHKHRSKKTKNTTVRPK